MFNIWSIGTEIGILGTLFSLVIAPAILIWSYLSWKAGKVWKMNLILSLITFLIGTVLNFGFFFHILILFNPLVYPIFLLFLTIKVRKEDKKSPYYKFLLKIFIFGIVLSLIIFFGLALFLIGLANPG